MGSIDDPQGFREAFQREREKLDESALPDRYRQAILGFINDRADRCEVSTLREYMKTLRVAGDRADTPLVDMALEDAKAFRTDLLHNPAYGRGGEPLAQRTVGNYMWVLRLLFDFLGREWAEEIEIEKDDPPIDPRDMLTADDIEALIDAATRNRDIALVEFLAGTGARLSLVASLRVKDVDLDAERPHYIPNADALGLKGAAIKPYPIIDARASLRTYLRQTHPRPDAPEAALFHRFDVPSERPFDDAGAVTPSQLYNRLRTLKEQADLAKPTNPHNFRHSAITRMWREGFSQQQIQHRVHWALDTDMWERYVHVRAEDMNETIFAEAGLVDADGADTMVRQRCGTCRETLAEHHSYCPVCGEPATPDARESVDEAAADTIAGIQFGPDEEVLHDARPSWAAWPKTVSAALLLALPTVGISLLLLVYPWMARKKTRYVVTSHRVVKVEGGLIGQETTEYRIDDVRTLRTSASTLEKLASTGTIELDTHSGATMTLEAVPNRDDVANTIRSRQTA